LGKPTVGVALDTEAAYRPRGLDISRSGLGDRRVGGVSGRLLPRRDFVDRRRRRQRFRQAGVDSKPKIREPHSVEKVSKLESGRSPGSERPLGA